MSKSQGVFLIISFLLSSLFFILTSSPALAVGAQVNRSIDPPGSVMSGAQLPDGNTIKRLIPSAYGFGWIKYQYALGSAQPLESWIKAARDNNYRVLISAVKNNVGIEKLQNPGTDYETGKPDSWYSEQYCPYDEELETFTYSCGTDEEGSVRWCREKARPKPDNGYIKFRDTMQALAPRLKDVDAVEIWNEPNIKDEWFGDDPATQSLGPISAKNYANFLNCGIKGLRKGDYNGITISAGLAPNAYTESLNIASTSVNDIAFFAEFVDNGGLKNVDKIGWHGNITNGLPPSSPNPEGFQRYKTAVAYAKSKGINKPVWMTEFGWKRDAQTGIDVINQAEFISQAYQLAPSLGDIETMIVWNFGFGSLKGANPEFKFWDIEGEDIETGPCQPNPPRIQLGDYGNTKYIAARSYQDDAQSLPVMQKALIPQEVIASDEKKISLVESTEGDVRKSFVDTIPKGLIRDLIASLACILDTSTCTPHLAVGKIEAVDPKIQTRPGKNTKELAIQSDTSRKSEVPEMKLIPAKQDCNLIKATEQGTIGYEDLNTLSSSLGTTTGTWGNSVYTLKTNNPEDYNSQINERRLVENEVLGGKLFIQGKQVPDADLQQDMYYKGNYPAGIAPLKCTPNDPNTADCINQTSPLP